MSAPGFTSAGLICLVLLALGASARAQSGSPITGQAQPTPLAGQVRPAAESGQTPQGDAGSGVQDACSLLSNSAIKAALGEPLKQAKGSRAKGDSMIVLQCFFEMPTFANSISLVLAVPDPDDSTHSGPQNAWQKWFRDGDESEHHAEEDDRRRSATGGKEEEAALRPAAIAGLGDEAYWVQGLAGTLYVLRGNSILRVSVGGKADDAARLQRAQALARDALIHLDSIQ